ncbi:hypothetical protein K435DRAFT_873713 [Dendrothele bispora CBS 962.96]|uniref:Uncharacterized protein n=1 Tax=Dendrothele bispora (strain CBS 962.96) TaxID=1314807 RepID=A0A4S8KYH5_DENBC|nr:hypothetical protein K435DRAFT_873713 [Dendrothele bispora CBS 962.96]
MEIYVRKGLESRMEEARHVVEGVLNDPRMEFSSYGVQKLSLTTWLHRSGEDLDDHYTIRAYNESGELVLSIHAPQNHCYPPKKNKQTRVSGPAAGFDPSNHVWIDGPKRGVEEVAEELDGTAPAKL